MNGAEIRRLSARELAARVRDGEVSARRVAEAYLERARQVEKTVRAFLHLDAAEVLRVADELDKRRERGERLGPLAGVPVAVKDNFATRGVPTTCGSRLLEGHRPLYDATAVSRLREADAIVFGKTNLDEFGMGSSTEHSGFQPTHNPWDVSRVPGGSSGGSAAALASGAALLALGSDTGGSVRQPAAFCGLVGVKPQYGRIPRYGLVAFASSLDTVGVLARTTSDAAFLLETLSGPDRQDATAIAHGGFPLSATGPARGDTLTARGDLPHDAPTAKRDSSHHAPTASAKSLRVGVLRDLDFRDPALHDLPESGEAARASGAPLDATFGVEATRALEEAKRRFFELGASIDEVSLPMLRHAVPIYHVLADAEASANLARYDGVRYGCPSLVEKALAEASGIEPFQARVRGIGFGLEVKRRILLGTFALSRGYADEYYERARQARAALTEAMFDLFDSVDVLLLPTTPGAAFPFGERDDPLAMYASDLFTVLANLTGAPAVSVPICRSRTSRSGASLGLPLAVQLMGRPYGERDLLSIASRIEAMGDGAGSVERDPESPAFGEWSARRCDDEGAELGVRDRPLRVRTSTSVPPNSDGNSRLGREAHAQASAEGNANAGAQSHRKPSAVSDTGEGEPTPVFSSTAPTADAFEVVIGLEVHAQLLTASKLFCACSVVTPDEPNSATCPVCLGHPGAMPYLNTTAVDLAVRLGLALGCEVHQRTEWARKNYFYPDLPKGYQITQYAHPLCTGGAVPLDPPVSLVRIHLEEDAGKSKHTVDDLELETRRGVTSLGATLRGATLRGATLLDFNRAGVPLVEIVSAPVLRSPEEAGAYLSELRRIVRYLQVSDGNMEDGSLRCDANLSLRPRGSSELGTRTEIKNLNSIRNVVRALRHEAERQRALLERGVPVTQETRLYDESTGRTRVMRAKEESSDYRYFPEPDLPPLELSEARLDEISVAIPELPHRRRARFADAYGLADEEIAVLTETPELGQYFECVVELLRARVLEDGSSRASMSDAPSGAPKGTVSDAPNDAGRPTESDAASDAPKLAAKWIRGDVLGRLASLPPADELAELLHRVREGSLTGPMAKQALAELAATGDTVEAIVARHGWVVVADDAQLRAWVREAMANHPGEVDSYRAGRTGLLRFFVGQVMKLSRGQADPVALGSVLDEELGRG